MWISRQKTVGAGVGRYKNQVRRDRRYWRRMTQEVT